MIKVFHLCWWKIDYYIYDHNLCQGNIRFPFEIQKPRNDEDLARHLGPTDRRMDGQTDRLAYRDAKTHLKTRRGMRHKSYAVFFSARWKKEVTNGPTDQRTNGQTHPLIELWLTTKNRNQFESIWTCFKVMLEVGARTNSSAFILDLFLLLLFFSFC